MHASTRRTLYRARRGLGRWLDRLAPQGCCLCGETLAPQAFPALCIGCLLDLPGAKRPRCARCAQPTDRAAPACTACATTDPCPPVSATLAVGDYAPPMDRVVTSLKFGRQIVLAKPLGELLAARWLGNPEPVRLDCLVPVPLGASRLAQRGFNQALEMARAMSRALATPLPVLPRRLLRVRDTPAQSGLALDERRRNLQGCFRCRGRLDGLHIGLIDDVMTSGSTLAEAARTLRGAGAARVVALVVARTP